MPSNVSNASATVNRNQQRSQRGLNPRPRPEDDWDFLSSIEVDPTGEEVSLATQRAQSRYGSSIAKLQGFFGMRSGVSPRLRRICGRGDAALILNQIVCYWFARDPQNRIRARIMKSKIRWIAKSYAEWAHEIGMTAKQARTAVDTLVDLGLIERRVMKFNGRPTAHVRPLTANIAEAANVPPDQEPYRKRREPFINPTAPVYLNGQLVDRPELLTPEQWQQVRQQHANREDRRRTRNRRNPR